MARESISGDIKKAATPLPPIDEEAFAAAFDRCGDRRVVLLGEASHGTSEFYRARAAITRRLVERFGFNIVAAEADWPDAAAIDRQVRGRPPADTGERPFRRFPTWMWRNREFADFTNWLKEHNGGLPPEQRTGFYGLDLYSMSASIAAVLSYLDRVDPAAAKAARERYGCLTPWRSDPAVYGRAVLAGRYRTCEPEVTEQLKNILERRLEQDSEAGESYLDAQQNARLVAAAERYYRIMYYGGAQAWNLRDTHMFDTLRHILEARGPRAKAVVWAHNSHIGNAAATEMGTVRDELNIGQLCREHFGADAALIGLGTHTGTVAAADDWDGPMEVMEVRPSLPESYERCCHDAGLSPFLLDFATMEDASVRLLKPPRLERFIGVIYRPESERESHYMQASLPPQFDSYLWFDRTSAVQPLPSDVEEAAEETYPFGV